MAISRMPAQSTVMRYLLVLLFSLLQSHLADVKFIKMYYSSLIYGIE
jgi:hypothetical protein